MACLVTRQPSLWHRSKGGRRRADAAPMRHLVASCVQNIIAQAGRSARLCWRAGSVRHIKALEVLQRAGQRVALFAQILRLQGTVAE